jgi:putative ubiquitin-RnfH superfamily antitoxin RatB of RatAB toxin-antitoxin module
MIEVEIIYALPNEQILYKVCVPNATEVESAIKRSGILKKYPEIDIKINKIGIFGKFCKLSQKLSAGDRIEIYRPLCADPGEMRRNRIKPRL